jgi:hypothetical protein
VAADDSYATAFGAGEIALLFGGKRIILAYAAGGKPLGPEGFAQRVAPGDKAGGRFVANIAAIAVRDAGRLSGKRCGAGASPSGKRAAFRPAPRNRRTRWVHLYEAMKPGRQAPACRLGCDREEGRP